MVAWAQPEVCVTFAMQVIFSLIRFFADSPIFRGGAL